MTASKILVVEDEGLVGLELSQALARMGYEVMEAVPSGDRALEKISGERPDLILMDIRIEGVLDGIQTAQKIREQFSIPVIYLTAHSDETTLQRAKLTESYGYLLKPFEERSLRAAIEMALHKAHREREQEAEQEWNTAIAEHISEGLIITDTHGIIRYVNQTASEMARRSPDQCRNKILSEVFTAADSLTKEPVLLPLSSVVIEDRTIVSDRLLLFGNETERFFAECIMKPVKDKSNTSIGVIILLKSIPEKEKSEREIRFELERSKKYQYDLLPEKGRSILGITSHWLFHPSAFGSGDIFNLFPLDGTHVGFYLLDVMGHGFPAAVLAITLYSFLSYDIARLGILKRSERTPPPSLSEYGMIKDTAILSPWQVIDELNRRFFFKAADNPFFTLIYGIINMKTCTGTLARAGGPHPLLMNKSGGIERLSSRGQAIGAFPEISVEEKEFSFSPGSRLFLYSDGLVDQLEKGVWSLTADQKLEDFIKQNNRSSCAELCSSLDALLISIHPDPRFEDDIAFFALENTAGCR